MLSKSFQLASGISAFWENIDREKVTDVEAMRWIENLYA
jgi:hypothetical protein